jgi:outer membrane lipoprotein carrier protein
MIVMINDNVKIGSVMMRSENSIFRLLSRNHLCYDEYVMTKKNPESRDLQSPGSGQGVARCPREVALFKEASCSCRRGLHWNKRRFFAAVLFFGIVASVTVQPVIAQTVDEAVTAVEKHYQELSDLTAKVTQKNLLKSFGKTQVFEGTLWIKKPGKLRLAYKNGQLIVIDGKAALFYSEKSAQVIKKTFTDFEHMNIPVAFLLGAAHIRDDFDARRSDPGMPRLFELIPKKAGAAMKKLQLLSDDSGRIMKLMIFDRSGNETELVFSDAREGAGIDDQLFAFKPPKGTEIIEQ